jgi:hypothetical protein
VRTPAKLVALARDIGHTQFADMLQGCLDGRGAEFTSWVLSYFKGEPAFKISNKQMCKLLYEVMALPIRVRGKPTAKMKAAGIPLHAHTGALVKHMKRFSLDYDYYGMYWTMDNIQKKIKEQQD